MSADIVRTAHDRESWRTAATTIFRAGERMLEAGYELQVTLKEHEDKLTLRQLRFIHGPVLRQISEQVSVGGVKYAPEIWKEHLKQLFLPDQWDMVRMPFVQDVRTGQWRPSKRKVPVKRRKSLTDLGVKRCSIFIDQVLAHAAVEWGVQFVFEFDEREAVRYVPPRSKQRAKPRAEEPAAPAPAPLPRAHAKQAEEATA